MAPDRGGVLKPELDDYLREECRKRGLSLRGLSIKAGLSAATVRNILKREYHPTLTSLNQLADYLGVRRQYLWYLAGLLEDIDFGLEADITDGRLKLLFDRVNKLPFPARSLIIKLIETTLTFVQAGGENLVPQTRAEQYPYTSEEEGPFQHEN
ncbi:MAG TPA: helix-turn-helix domain-containing protein [Dehalococcoidia bacterium]|nr:helix-turn-helix domain-containing protein [Dehalococcoidia bacterium]